MIEEVEQDLPPTATERDFLAEMSIVMDKYIDMAK
jgi:hypothetical protein